MTLYIVTKVSIGLVDELLQFMTDVTQLDCVEVVIQVEFFNDTAVPHFGCDVSQIVMVDMLGPHLHLKILNIPVQRLDGLQLGLRNINLQSAIAAPIEDAIAIHKPG